MATQARGLIREENLSVHSDVAPLGVKTNVSKSQKKGGRLGGRKKLRKGLSELPNSGKPYARQSSNDNHSEKLGAAVKEWDISIELVHNHEECIEELEQEWKGIYRYEEGIKFEEKWWKSMYGGDFPHPDGLENDNTMQLASPQPSLLSSELKADSPPSSLERDEMYDLLRLDEFLGLEAGAMLRWTRIRTRALCKEVPKS